MDDAIFESFRQTLNGGGVKAVAAPQLFTTPPALAERMAALADITPAHRILEPSAGTGNLLRAVPPCAEIVAVEINHTLAHGLHRLGIPGLHVIHDDFMTCDDLGTFDRAIMNPPFENGADIKHIRRALSMVRTGGFVVALCANGPRQIRDLQPLAEESGGFYEPLPPGTFKTSGTMVNTAILVINA